MIDKIHIIKNLLQKPWNLRILLSIQYRDDQVESNWFKRADKIESVDADGNPIPWYPYPFLTFINMVMNILLLPAYRIVKAVEKVTS